MIFIVVEAYEMQGEGIRMANPRTPSVVEGEKSGPIRSTFNRIQ